jgi:hypothetical protein
MSLFTFNTSIPAAQNNPSADQSPMLQNNLSTEMLIGVDHVTFNAMGGGEHTAITFNQPPDPYVPTPNAMNPPKLFTNNKDGQGTSFPNGFSQLFYYVGAVAQTQNQYISATNGSTMALGGIIIKWGVVNNAPDNTLISFTNPFPQNCFSVQATVYQSSGNPITVTVSPTPTVSGFTPRIRLASSGAPVSNTISYIAIGN